MDDSGSSKDDIDLPEGEIGERIKKMNAEGKDVSKCMVQYCQVVFADYVQPLSFSRLWVRRSLWTAKKAPNRIRTSIFLSPCDTSKCGVDRQFQTIPGTEPGFKSQGLTITIEH